MSTSRASLVKEVEDGIVALINERYAPGDKIPNEFDLANELNVARSTVREAVKMLISRNVLEIRRGCGTFVSENPGLVEDPWGLYLIKDKIHVAKNLLELRMIIEPRLAMLAALRGTDDEIAAIHEACALTETDIMNGVPHKEHDVNFHLAIAQAAHNDIAVCIMKQIFAQSIDMFIELNQNSLLKETIETHTEISESIASHDADKANRAMQLHLEYNRISIENLGDPLNN